MPDDMHVKTDSDQEQVAGEPCRLYALPLSHHHLNGMFDLFVAPRVQHHAHVRIYIFIQLFVLV